MENIKGLHDINETLKEQNDIIRQMLDKMPKPESKFIAMLQMVVLIISAFGFINLIDVIIKWIGGN